MLFIYNLPGLMRKMPNALAGFDTRFFSGLAIAVGLTAPLAAQYSVEHPVVLQMVEKGVEYLQKADSPDRPRGGGYREGAEILAGYAVYKVKGDSSLPVVIRGLRVAERMINQLASSDRAIHSEKIMYELSVATILLATVDIDKYRGQCVTARDFLLSVQRANGGFGYLEGGRARLGDISQIQYVILALWTLDQLGVDVPMEPIERCVDFLKAAQDNTGGWPYQYPTEPGGSPAPTNSLSGAGLCAVLVSGDLLGAFRNRKSDGNDLVPAAFRSVTGKEKSKKSTKVSRVEIDPIVERGVRWHLANPYSRDPNWHYYYRYSEERFEAFLEISRKKQQKSPPWYNRGVEDLKKAQKEDGSWGTEQMTFLTPDISTAFAVLFLIRSTQKSIGDLNEGMLTGGFQLPKNLANAGKSNSGKVVDKSASSSIDEMLQVMEDEDAEKGEDLMVSDRLKLDPNPSKRKEQLNRLSRLLNSNDWSARRVAAKLIGRGDDLDYVPALLYALSDSDPVVPRIAEDSLRIISRRLTTRHIPLEGELTAADRQRAAAAWTDWYRSVRPDFVLSSN